MNAPEIPTNSIGLYMDQLARTTAQRSIFVTGSVRTGTSAMTQYLHSLEGAECHYEPQLPNLLIPAIKSFDPDVWQLLFQTYLHEEGLLEAISGRRMNMNRHDNSSILHSKTEAEIQGRLDHSIRREEAREKSAFHRLVFKIPDMMPYLESLQNFYPDMTMVVMLRRPDNILRSIVEKGWYRDMSSERSQGVFPWRSPGKPYIPFWTSDEDMDRWQSLGEVERACRHYISVHKPLANMITSAPDSLQKMILVDYDKFVSEPAAFLPRLAKRIGMKPSEMSYALMNNFREPKKARNFDYGDVDSAAKDEIRMIADQLAAVCNI